MLFSALLLVLPAAASPVSPRSDLQPLAADGSLPLPQWLATLTGHTSWPGMDPPYIPLDAIDLGQVPASSDQWLRQQGQCSGVLRDTDACSFDCYHCIAPDDVTTCSSLSQTFDDGPSPWTPELTSALNTPLTFFTIGMNIVRFPQIYRDTADMGHVMGSHTWSHKFLPALSNEEIAAQIQWSLWAMQAVYGHTPRWFRPPYGGIDNRVRSIVRQFGMQSVLWDHDTFDWALASGHGQMTEEGLLQETVDFGTSHDGRGLILEHDSVEGTVHIAVALHGRLGANQLTVSQCAAKSSYIESFIGGP